MMCSFSSLHIWVQVAIVLSAAFVVGRGIAHGSAVLVTAIEALKRPKIR